MAYHGAGGQSPINYEAAGHRLEDLPSYVRLPLSIPSQHLLPTHCKLNDNLTTFLRVRMARQKKKLPMVY